MKELATSKVAKDRNMTPVANTPYGLSEGDRKAWWRIVSECTQGAPEKRPSMEFIQQQLSFLRDSVTGLYTMRPWWLLF